MRALQDAPAPNAGTAHSVANLVSFLNSMMLNSNTDLEYTESAYGASSDGGSSEERCKSREREYKKPKKAKAHEKKKKEKDKVDEPKKNTCPHCKTTTTRSPIALSRTNARGTKNIRDIASRRSAMSSRLISSHASSFRQNWAGMQRRTIRAANDGARGHRRKDRTRMTNGLQ